MWGRGEKRSWGERHKKPNSNNTCCRSWDGLLTTSIEVVGGGYVSISNPQRTKLSQLLTGTGTRDELIEFSGTPEHINYALTGLSFVSAKDFVGDVTVKITVADEFGDEVARNVVVGVVSSSNGEITVTVPKDGRFGKEVALLEDHVWISDEGSDNIVSVGVGAGVEAKATILHVAVGCKHGGVRLSAGDGEGEGWSGELSFSDLLNNVNSKLKTLQYSPSKDWAGVDIMTIAISGKDVNSVLTKFLYKVEAVNDSPTILIEEESSEMNMEGGDIRALPAIVVDDVDANNAVGDVRYSDLVTVKVELGEESNGGLSLEGVFGGDGYVVIHGCGGSGGWGVGWQKSLCFMSTISMATKTLSKVEYKASNFDVVDVVRISVDDNGNWAEGGGAESLVAVGEIEVKITPKMLDTKVLLQNLGGVFDDDSEGEITRGFAEIEEDSFLLFYPMLQSDESVSEELLTLEVGSLKGGKLEFRRSEHGREEDEAYTVIAGEDSKTLIFNGRAGSLSSLLKGNSANGAGIIYTPREDFNGYDVISLGLGGVVSSIDVHVLAVNDAPELTTSAGLATMSLTTEESVPLPITNIGLFDADSSEIEGAFMTVTVSCGSEEGTISTNGKYWSGVSVAKVDDASIVVMRGSAGALNSALMNGYLNFRPTDNFSGAGRIVVTASDEGNNGIGGVLSDTLEVDVTVKEIYNPPSLTFSKSRVEIVEDSVARLADFVSVSVKARDVAVDEKIVCLLSLGMNGGRMVFEEVEENGGVEVVGGTDEVWVLTGTTSGLGEFLTSKVSYTPKKNFNGLEVVSGSCGDGGEVGRLNIVVSSVNDGPSVILPVGNFEMVEDGETTLQNALNVYVVDPDAHEEGGSGGEFQTECTACMGHNHTHTHLISGFVHLTVSVSNPSCSLVLPNSVSQLGGLRATNLPGGAGLELVGSVSSVNNGVGAVTLRCEDNYFGENNMVEFTVRDDIDDGEIVKTARFDVIGVNDAPVVVAARDGVETVEDVSVSMGDFFSVEDVDAESEEAITLSMELVDGNIGGFLLEPEVAKTHDVAIVSLGANSLTISGTKIDLNSALESVKFVPSRDYNGYSHKGLELKVTDGEGLSTIRTVSVNVSSVADAPTVIVVAGVSELIVDEDTPLSLLGFFSVSSVDSEWVGVGVIPTFTVTVRTLQLGSISLSSPVPGGYVVADGHGNAFSVRGGIDVVQKVIDGLVFKGCEDCEGGDVIVVEVENEDGLKTAGERAEQRAEQRAKRVGHN